MVKEAEREAKEEELSLKKMKRRLDNLDHLAVTSDIVSVI